MGQRRKRLVAIAITVATVLASGQYMERSQVQPSSGPVVPLPHGQQAQALKDAAASLSEADFPSAPDAPAAGDPFQAALPEKRAMAGELRGMTARLGFSPDRAMAGLLPDEGDFGVSGLPCGPDLVAEARGQGIVRLVLSSPCRPGSRVTVHHDRLSFTGRFDPMGLLSFELPAMAASAVFVAEFDDGITVTRALSVPGADGMVRAALVARTGTGMHLHAFETGAAFGSPGHVWAAAPRGMGAHGQLRVLGDPSLAGGRMAEVYSAPAGARTPQMTIEAEVTALNCGRRIEAGILLPGEDGRTHAGHVSLTVPGCEAVGEFLELKNPPQDRTLAAN